MEKWVKREKIQTRMSLQKVLEKEKRHTSYWSTITSNFATTFFSKFESYVPQDTKKSLSVYRIL